VFPLGIVKLNTAAEEVPPLVIMADVPSLPVTTVPTDIVAEVPVAPVAPVAPVDPVAPVAPVCPTGPTVPVPTTVIIADVSIALTVSPRVTVNVFSVDVSPAPETPPTAMVKRFVAIYLVTSARTFTVPAIIVVITPLLFSSKSQ
jgi:hypothetical protein